MDSDESPRLVPLSPASAALFSKSERIKPLDLSVPSSSASKTVPNWKEVAREIEAELRIYKFNGVDV